MAITYICDACKKKTKKVIFLSPMFAFSKRAPYRHLCRECWESVVKFLRKGVKS